MFNCLKIGGLVSNTNDYGLNDVSARDSSDDESGPKKPVPSWALSKWLNQLKSFKFFYSCVEWMYRIIDNLK